MKVLNHSKLRRILPEKDVSVPESCVIFCFYCEMFYSPTLVSTLWFSSIPSLEEKKEAHHCYNLQ